MDWPSMVENVLLRCPLPLLGCRVAVPARDLVTIYDSWLEALSFSAVFRLFGVKNCLH
jgi:hypothetical protein